MLTTRTAVLGALLLAAIALAACSSKPEWTEFEHEQGRFTVSFPTAKTPEGETKGTFSTLSVMWKDTKYLVGWQPIPDISQEEYLQGLETSAKQVGTVTSSARATHAGMRGMDFHITSPQGGTKRFLRYLRKGNRLYTVEIQAAKLDVEAPVSQQFLASFSAK